MKTLLYIFLFLSVAIVTAQEASIEKTNQFSYGIVIGGNFYNITNNNTADAFIPEDISPSFIVGIFGEYNFTKNMGVKIDANYYNKDFLFDIKNKLITMNFIDISTNFKYDFGEKYREGFYLLGGPKISIIADADSDNEDVKHHFELVNYVAQLGFGCRIYKYFDLQTKFEYGVTPFFKLDNGHNSKFVNTIVTLNIDIAKMFK